jgi:GTP-binding protein EngB required for normal cell division
MKIDLNASWESEDQEEQDDDYDSALFAFHGFDEAQEREAIRRSLEEAAGSTSEITQGWHEKSFPPFLADSRAKAVAGTKDAIPLAAARHVEKVTPDTTTVIPDPSQLAAQTAKADEVIISVPEIDKIVNVTVKPEDKVCDIIRELEKNTNTGKTFQLFACSNIAGQIYSDAVLMEEELMSAVLSLPKYAEGGKHFKARIQKQMYVALVGDPGVGKSAILSGYFQKQLKFGPTSGTAMTTEIEEVKHPKDENIRGLDLMGLGDPEKSKEYRKAVRSALMKGAAYRVVFVIHAMGGRLTKSEIDMMASIFRSLPPEMRKGNFGIIVNKIDKGTDDFLDLESDQIKADGSKYTNREMLEKRLHELVAKESAGTPHVFFQPYDDGLMGEQDGVARLPPKLRLFLQNIPMIYMDSDAIGDMQAKEAQLEQQIEHLQIEAARIRDIRETKETQLEQQIEHLEDELARIRDAQRESGAKEAQLEQQIEHLQEEAARIRDDREHVAGERSFNVKCWTLIVAIASLCALVQFVKYFQAHSKSAYLAYFCCAALPLSFLILGYAPAFFCEDLKSKPLAQWDDASRLPNDLVLRGINLSGDFFTLYDIIQNATPKVTRIFYKGIAVATSRCNVELIGTETKADEEDGTDPNAWIVVLLFWLLSTTIAIEMTVCQFGKDRFKFLPGGILDLLDWLQVIIAFVYSWLDEDWRILAIGCFKVSVVFGMENCSLWHNIWKFFRNIIRGKND